MKMQFKLNPVGLAVLSVLFTPVVYAQETSNHTSKYAGQDFFERYYVKDDADPSTPHFNRFCRGTWATPVNRNIQAESLEDSESTIEADYAYYNPTGDSELSGNVVISQPGRQIRAEKLILDETQTFAKAIGQVEMAQGGIVAQSEAVNYNLKGQVGEFENSYYISEQTHAHGKAEKISRPDQNRVILKNATYSACAPSASPIWRIQAKEIELNQETGRGITKGTKLYIKNTPVFAIPYFNFPIDDRRTTGLLNPNFGYSNDGGIQIATPIYLNLAPNYDATVTPRYIGNRGAMLEGEFRYLSKNFGEGRISGGYLPSDDKYLNQDRKHLTYRHDWKINSQLTSFAEYNYASDKDYFADLSDNPNVRSDLNLRRIIQLDYANGIPGLTARLKTETFQTLDKEVLDINRPYARLPQLLVNYVGGDMQGWQYEYNNDTAYFKKNNTEQENNGVRLYNDLTVRYNFRRPYAFAIPSASIRSIHTWYDSNSLHGQRTNDDSASVVVPQFTLDTGLLFEKQGKYLQTISPRAFYAYAPYKNQVDNPNFDTTTASINYDQLFSPSRFYGHDRLDDNNFLTLGVNYRLFDKVGLERLRAGIAQSFFFEDRRVNVVRGIDTEKRTGAILNLGSQFTDKLSANANIAWTASGEQAQRDVQFYYTGDTGSLYNVGYYYRKDILGRQNRYNQTVVSMIQPVKDNWRVLAHAQYDIDHDIMRDMLVGINYESCCWGVSVYGRSYYNDLDNVVNPDVKPNKAVMAEFTLKGLGSLNNKLNSLLESRVLGFNKTNQYWTQY